MPRASARLLACAAAAILISIPPARAGFDDKGPINYTVDGATASGYFKVVTEAINGIIREVYPGSAATYKPGSPAGGIQNISIGQSDMTFNAGGPEIEYALEGKAPFRESLKGKFQFVMMLHNGLVVHNIMTKEWADRNGIASFEDIAAKKPQMRLAVNQPANLQSTVGMYIAEFEAYGLKEAELTRGGASIRANAATGLDALRDGKIDVFINGGFVPTAEMTDVARGRALQWISGSVAKMKQAGGRWNYDLFTVKKEAYPFLTKDEITYTQWSAIVAGGQVSEETVYKFVKALAENEARVRSIHPSLAEFSIKSVSHNSTGVPYHPGAERYYRQVGLVK
ncbi:MAG TPA: TAXI family TRAP transporter solute-binding subunit [Alphaproteobacteria bacterium]